MAPKDCAKFIQACTNDHCPNDDRRVVDVFDKHDKDKDGFLSADDFLDFYGLAAK